MSAPTPPSGGGITTLTLLNALCTLTDDLTALLKKETALLARPVMGELEEIGREKSRLAARHEMIARELASRPVAETRSHPQAARLGQLMRQLGEHARANAKALELHMKANQRVLDVVVRAAREAIQPSFSYGRERLGYGTRGGRSAAVAYNRVL